MELDIQSNREIIKVIIADDQLTIRSSLQYQLATVNDIEVVGVAKDGIEALEKIAELDPDIIIIDLEMPHMDGLTAIKEICNSFPQTKPLVFSTHEEREYINRAIIAGAKGYLLKGTSTEDLVNAIRNVYRGYFQLGSGLLEKISLPTSQVVFDTKNVESKIDFDIKEETKNNSKLTDKNKNAIEITKNNHENISYNLIQKKIQLITVEQANISEKFKKIELKFQLLLCWQLILTLILLLKI